MNILSSFETVAARQPDKTAVADENHCCSFSGLRDLAARLGAAVRARQPEGGAVGVLVRRGADTAVLFFAAVYGGCFYVPLDPELPPHKLGTILTDAGIRLVLGAAGDEDVLDAAEFRGTLLTPADAAELPAELPELPDEAPLYMVYTSGSTGKPKGVLKSHGAMASYIAAFQARFGLTGEEIIGNQNPFFFDAAAKDIYYMACLGATLEVIPSEKFIFPVRLVEYLNERKISYICWVPTALAIVTQLNTFRQLLPQTLRNVFFVGEPFPIKQLHKWLSTLPELRYVNLYGSSELAGVCCAYEIPRGALPEALPMGRPLPNCRVFLHGEAGFLSEPGVLGEVWIAGPALALGYWNDPEKTAAVFTEERLPDGTRARVLRSGDLAEYNEEGNLVFVSRKDFQIKHMGRRIELGEIETVADSLPEIARCCCLYNDAKKRIELFCELNEAYQAASVHESNVGTSIACPQNEPAPDGKAIQSLLRPLLSDYMLPAKVHVLDKLPLNPNGKLHRQAMKEMM
ncbi:MAG: amino acid adenylation domain-containing protein [Oscillospiraceae bacterium]|nr:amino acid adenylation domain-containing protein [Oscillospiraceae bacterium]